jgi:hypothetical protein
MSARSRCIWHATKPFCCSSSSSIGNQTHHVRKDTLFTNLRFYEGCVRDGGERMVEKIWICRSGSLFLWRVWWHWCNLAKRDSKSDQSYWLLICKSIHNDNRWWPACYRYVFLRLSFGDFFSLCFSYELFHIWNCCMLYIYREDYPWKAWTFAEINIPHKEFCGNCMGWEEFQWEISYWTFPLFVNKSRALE